MTKSKLSPIFRKIKAILSWSAITKLSIILSLVILCILTWIYSEHILNFPHPGKLSLDKPPLELSKDGLQSIDNVVRKSDLIVGISVISVNFQQNSRKIIHFNTDDSELLRLHDEYVLTHVSVDQPLFNNDQDNNKRIIRLINGDFVCTKYPLTVTYKYAPNVKIETVCALGVPPYYGQFRGFILVYLQHEPSPLEVDQVRILLRDLSDRLDNPTSK